MKATRAKYLATACENCHTQLSNLNDHYEMNTDVRFLSSMIAGAYSVNTEPRGPGFDYREKVDILIMGLVSSQLSNPVGSDFISDRQVACKMPPYKADCLLLIAW